MFIRKSSIVFLLLLVCCGSHLYSSELGALFAVLQRHPVYVELHATMQDLQYQARRTFDKPEGTPGVTLLHIAAQNGHMPVARLLIQCGADVNAQTKDLKLTPLFVAAGAGHTAVVSKLIAAGARVNDRTKDGESPLSIASQKRYEGVAQLLRDAGAHE